MRKWRYKVRDDETGLTYDRSRVRVRPTDGAVVHKKGYERQHPQLFVRVTKNDPTVPSIVRPDILPEATIIYDTTSDISLDRDKFAHYTSDVTEPSRYIGDTSIRVTEGAATHLFLAGIGNMAIGDEVERFRFCVRDLDYSTPSYGVSPVYGEEQDTVTDDDTSDDTGSGGDGGGGGTIPEFSSEIGVAVIEGDDYRYIIA